MRFSGLWLALVSLSLFQSKDEPEGSEGTAKRVLSFRDLKLIHASSRGGGNVEIGPIDFQGLW